MRTRLEPWRHRLLAAFGVAPLICCGGSAFDGTEEGDAGSGGATNGGATSERGGTGGNTSGKGGSTSGKGGSTGTGGNTGSGGSAASGGTTTNGGTGFPCVDPQPLDLGTLGKDTGYEVCQGFMHRPEIKDCPVGLPREEPVVEPTEFDTCTADADCVDAPYGYCDYSYGGFDGVSPGRSCVYGCSSDADCGEGTICQCGSPVGHCVAASCTSDADCGAGFMCTTYSNDLCVANAYACQTPLDSCGSDLDCSGRCELGVDGVRTCSDAGCAVIGRPFLVGSETRVASEAARRDWLEPLAPCVDGLSAEERRELALFWTRSGLMEHASIAAFARFTLGLLALGAPAELVQASNEASADETRHAQACFALASAYAGDPIGPGRLQVGGALDDLSLATLVLTTIREGCAGETLAAIEASEQAAGAADPLVRSVLSGIAADEARHAELAWRFVAWALDQGGDALRELARAEFERVLREEQAGTSTSGLDLTRHGVLSPGESRRLRQQALSDVVQPCAAALLDRASRQKRSTTELASMT